MTILKIVAANIILILLVPTVYAEEKFNFGEKWIKSAIPEKISFLEGYHSGYIFGVLNATKFFLPTKTQQEKEEAFKKASMIYSDRLLGNDMLVNLTLVMDQLYKDPANSYIEKGVILELALSKLRGGDIAEDLIMQREVARGEEKK